MRHRVFGKKLGRDINARKVLLANLANSVFEHGHVTTTQSKAKFAKSHIEKLITKAKKNRLFLRREMASSLTNKAFIRLIDEIGPGFVSRTGGYSRIIKLGKRRGDASSMVRLELVKWESPKVQKKRSQKALKLNRKHRVATRRSVHSKPSVTSVIKKQSKSASSVVATKGKR